MYNQLFMHLYIQDIDIYCTSVPIMVLHLGDGVANKVMCLPHGTYLLVEKTETKRQIKYVLTGNKECYEEKNAKINLCFYLSTVVRRLFWRRSKQRPD